MHLVVEIENQKFVIFRGNNIDVVIEDINENDIPKNNAVSI